LEVLLQPLPGNRTFRYSLSWGIGLYALAPPGGSRATPRDLSDILPDPAVAVLGTTRENVLMVEQYYPKTITFKLVICYSLKKKVILRGRPHRGICFEFEFLGEFKFIFEKVLG
jgi:hypothetical protein